MYETEVKIVDTFSSLADYRNNLEQLLEELDSVLLKVKLEFDKRNIYFSDVPKNISKYNDKRCLDIVEVMKAVDKDLWDEAITISGIERVLTYKDREDMRSEYSENPPVFDENVAREFVSRVQGSGNDIAMATVRKIFDRVTQTTFRKGNKYTQEKDYRCGRKIEKSFRMSLFYRSLPEYILPEKDCAFLNDLEVVCALVASDKRPEYPNTIGDKMKECLRKNELHIENDYFEVQLFKNGNIKIDFKSDDVLEKLNTWGSDGTRIGV